MRNVPCDLTQLDLGNGESVSVSYLASGCYSAAYRATVDKKRVFILVEQCDYEEHGRDRSKEVLALARTYHTNKHLPQLKCYGTRCIEHHKYEVWETRYSKSSPPKSDDVHVSPEANALASISYTNTKDIEQEAKKRTLNLSPSLIEAVKDIERACESFGLKRDACFGDRYMYDMQAGNFGLDPDTKTLILRDPMTAFFNQCLAEAQGMQQSPRGLVQQGGSMNRNHRESRAFLGVFVGLLVASGLIWLFS